MSGAPSDSYGHGLFRTASAGNLSRRFKALRRVTAGTMPRPTRNRAPKKPRGTRVIDRFAEALAETGDVPTAAQQIGIKLGYGNALFAKIRRELGAQAV